MTYEEKFRKQIAYHKRCYKELGSDEKDFELDLYVSWLMQRKQASYWRDTCIMLAAAALLLVLVVFK